MNQCLKTIFVKTMVKIFNNSKTSGWSTYYCIVFMFFSVYQTSVTHCNFLGSNHRKISIFWLRLELLEINVKTIKNIPFIWQFLKKKGKKNLAILVVLRKKMTLLQESNWNDSAHQKNIDIFTLGIHCKCGYQICQDFSGSFDAHILIPSFPQKVTDWLQKH